MLDKDYYSGWTPEWENGEAEATENIYCMFIVLATITLWVSMLWLM